MDFGYAQVSTPTQKLDLQVDTLLKENGRTSDRSRWRYGRQLPVTRDGDFYGIRKPKVQVLVWIHR